jgi:hypothetical protein
MNVTAIRKNGDPRDPTRDALREAIAARAVAHAEAERLQEAVGRAREMARAADEKMNRAAEELEMARASHATALAQAATTGVTPKANGALRVARATLHDSEDELEAARTALQRLEADRIDDRAAQAENNVLVAVAKVLAPVCEELLAEAVRRRAELLALTQTLFVLTSEETAVPRVGGEVQRAVAADARRAPLMDLRERVLRLNLLPTQEELITAQSAIRSWIEWRTALRRDADAPLPDWR